VQEGIACHAAPGCYIPGCGWIMGGYVQRLPWRKFFHGKHEFHNQLTAAFFAQIKCLIGFRRNMFHSSSLSQKITVTLFAFLFGK
jgi:hypothetical protein